MLKGDQQMGHNATFFTQSEIIEPVSPQAAQLVVHF